jgi:hypothetical protein
MTTWSQCRVLIGLALAACSCGGSTANPSESDSAATSDAGEEPAESRTDSDGSPDEVDSAVACVVVELGNDSSCPLDWDTANQEHCHLEQEPSPGCDYLRVPVGGVDTSELCFYNPGDHKLVGGRTHSAVFNSTRCWALEPGFFDPLGCQYAAEICPRDASYPPQNGD